MTLATLFIIEFESTVELQVVVGITKTTVAVRIPQQSVVLIREYERNADLGVILEQILVLTLHVKLLALVLTQAIESLIVGTVELHLPRQTMLLLLGDGTACLHTQLALRYGKVPELLAFLGLFEQLFARGIEEGNLTGGLLYHCLYLLCSDHHVVALVGNGVRALGRCCHRYPDERGRLNRQRILTGGTHTDNLVVNHLKVNYLGLTTIRRNSHIVSIGLHHGCHHG